LVSIAIGETSSSVQVGSGEQLTAIGTYSDGSTKDLSGQVNWSSSAASVVGVSSTGFASAVATGTATIGASLNGVSTSAALNVTPIPVPPNPAFVATGAKLKAKLHKSLSATVANFKDPKTKPANFHAVVDWGDNSATTIGKIKSVASGKYTVTSSHKYGANGTYQVTISITDAQGRVRVVHTSVKVSK
jgi:hypothetical protein